MVSKKVLIVLTLIVSLLWMCAEKPQTHPDATEPDVMVEYVEMSAQERQLKLAECASCHPEEHHNEMIGPHAQSYVKLLEHLAMADTSRHFPRPYHKFVTEATEQACVTCHSAKNLFETNYQGLESLTDLSRFTEEAYPDAWKLPPPRPPGESRLTGIDCLTCHQQGERMITTEDFVRNPKVEAPCNPLASKFFSSNHNCITCHRITNEGMTDNLNNAHLVKTMSCNGCHMETEQNGSYTHYYYWRHDAKEKDQFPLLKKAFDDIEVTRLANKNSLRFVWNNASAPHRFSECAELFVRLDLYDSTGKLCGQFRKRLNNKSSHDKTLQPFFGDAPIWGEVGCAFLPDENQCSDMIMIKSKDVQCVDVTGFEKPQYWISDSLAQEVYFNTINP